MTIRVGERLPDARFMELDADGPMERRSGEIFGGRGVALLAVPGAFTRTCSAAHLPSFMRTADGFRAAGVDEIACVAVNDPFVMRAWAEATGADATGIRMLADADGAFTEAIGMLQDIPPIGLYRRSRRYSMLVEDGVVRQLNLETGRECDISAGETLLDQIRSGAAA